MIIGFVLLIYGAEYLVKGAVAIANKLKIPALIVGLTIVAFGTSTPEFVVSIKAALNGAGGISIGNIVGSNIFNTMCILSICSFISPLTMDLFAIIDIIFMIVIFTAFFIYSLKKDKIEKSAGIIMVATYVLYFIFVILREYFWF